MRPRGYAATLSDLVRVYPDDDLKQHLAQTYRLQIERVLAELAGLMRHYRTRVAKKVYEREEAEHQLIGAWVVTESDNVHTLERSLKFLLKRQRALADILEPGVNAQ